MIPDKKEQILARVFRQCGHCRQCDQEKRSFVIQALCIARRIAEVPGAVRVKGGKFAIPVGGASLEFNWSEPYATELNIICPE